jgi:DNA polymerase III beta subunit, central domain
MTTVIQEHAAVLTTGPQLRKAVRWVTGLPVLACGAVRVIVAGNDLILSATDFETTRLVWLELAASGAPEVAQVLVPGRLLTEIAAAMPAGPVEVSVTGGVQVDLTGDPGGEGANRVSVVPDQGYDSYPAQPALPGPAGQGDMAALAAAVARVAVAADDGRTAPVPWLSAIRMQTGAEGLLMGATDRYKIAAELLPWTGGQDTADVLFPAVQVKAFCRAADGQAAYLYADTGPLVALTDGTWTVITRRVVADPVDVHGYITGQERKHRFAGQITVDARTLATVLKEPARIKGALAEGRTLPAITYLDVATTAGQDGLTLTLCRGEKPWTATCDAATDCGQVTAGWNPAYLASILGVLDGDVVIHLAAPGKDGRLLKPVKITCQASPGWTGMLAMCDPSK